MPKKTDIPGKRQSSKRTAYTQRQDHEGFEVPNGRIFKLACCDCGLVHQIVVIALGLKKGAPLGMAAKRDNRATAARRRGLKAQVKPAMSLVVDQRRQHGVRPLNAQVRDAAPTNINTEG